MKIKSVKLSFQVEVVDSAPCGRYTAFCCVWIDSTLDVGEPFLLLHDNESEGMPDEWKVSNGDAVEVVVEREEVA